jgi:hypothetical protein
MPSTNRYCVACTHCVAMPTGVKFSRCAHGYEDTLGFRFISQSLDCGPGFDDLEYCGVSRANKSLCGPGAKWFEPKPAGTFPEAAE